MRSMIAGIAVWLALAAQPHAEQVNLARPTEGTTYFNRPGADLATHDAELAACLLRVQESFHGPPVSIIGGVVGGMLADSQANYIRRLGIDNCMVIRGWRIVRLDPKQNDLASLSKAALREQMTSIVGAKEPPGVVARRWSNDAARPNVARYHMPGYLVGQSLSLKAVELPSRFDDQLKAVLHPEIGPLTKEVVRKPSPSEVLDAAPADSSIVVLRIKGPAPFKHMGLGLRREGPTAYHKASRDGRPEYFFVNVAARKESVQTLAFVVPPGRWHIHTLGGLITYCFGAPFFDLKAGDVVYAGSFDFGSDTLVPDMSLEPARTYLTLAPAALSRLRAADWTNGLTRACGEGGWMGYALEFPEMPYAPDYRRAGSAGPQVPSD